MNEVKKEKSLEGDKVRFSISLNPEENNLLENMIRDYEEMGIPISKASLIRKLMWETKAMNEYREVIYGY
jgi:hypothetical protein